MKPELTIKQHCDIIRRVIGNPDTMSKETIIFLLEHALVKALGKNSEQRRELRRLNQSVRYIKALETQVQSLENEVNSLVELLDRDDEENNDTDPAPAPINVVSQTISQSYEDWDLATRFPSLKPRVVA